MAAVWRANEIAARSRYINAQQTYKTTKKRCFRGSERPDAGLRAAAWRIDIARAAVATSIGVE